MKLLFVYDLPPEHELFWQDGLWAALVELRKDWDIEYLNIQLYRDWKERIVKTTADFTLGWGSPTSPHFLPIYAKLSKGGWCFGGGDINNENLEKLGVVFVENQSQLIKPNFRHAFGTNTDLFFDRNQPKIIDALYPAAFANWKHQEVFAQYCQENNLKGLAVGYIQKDNLAESMELINECISRGVAVMDWIPYQSLALLYNMSKEVIITADASGGCERAILEAKASSVPLKVISTSQKLLDLARLSEAEVREKWNHLEYARKLKEGILEIWKE